MNEAFLLAIGAIAGAILGAWLRGVTEHRRWLRDLQQETYMAYLHALDRVDDATEDYMRDFCFMLEKADSALERAKERGVDSEARAEWRAGIVRDLEDKWRTLEGALDDLKRQTGRVEMLGSRRVDLSASVLPMAYRLWPSPDRLDGILEDSEHFEGECKRWREERRKRYDARRSFVGRARDDLGVDLWNAKRAARRRWHRLRARVRRRREKRPAG